MNELTKSYHVVMFSSGKASWAAAKLVAQRYGVEKLILLFADTLIEDEDNYRFLHEAAQNVGGELVIVCDGRTPWEVFRDVRYINHRAASCSKFLKQKPCRQFLESHSILTPENTTLYVGIDFNEYERMSKIQKGWQPWQVEAPLCWGKGLDHQEVINWAERENLKLPRLYQYGFSHANCGGYCVKAGKKQFKLLYDTFPDRYKYHEEQEQKFRQYLGRDDIGILRETRNKKMRIISLQEFRQRFEQDKQLSLDTEALGGCGCFIDEE